MSGTRRALNLLRSEIATIGSDPNRMLYGGRIEPDDLVLAARGQGRGLALYDDLARDPEVGTVLAKRRAALIGREWQVQPGGEEGDAAAADAAALLERALKGMRFNQAVGKALGALLRGISILEVMWAPVGNELRPVALLARDPRRFAFRDVETGGIELRLLTREQPWDGVPVPPRKFIVHRHGEADGYENPWGLGLGQRLFWPVFFKRQGIGFWLSALEKFGQPTAVGKYPPGSTQDQQDTLLAALQAIASEVGVVIPEGMVIELLEAKRSGAFDAYESLARYMDEDISKVVLGETLTTSGGDNGSRALGQVHDAVRLELTKSDGDELSDTLHATLCTWITELNRPDYVAGGGAIPRIWWDVSEPEDLAARAKRDVDVKGLGYRPTPEYIADTYGEGWLPDSPAVAPQDGLAALFAEARSSGRKPLAPPPGDEEPAEVWLAQQVDTVAQAETDAWLDAIRGVVDRAQSLEEIAAELLRLYPSLATGGLAAVMGQALAVANLTGRSEIADDLV